MSESKSDLDASDGENEGIHGQADEGKAGENRLVAERRGKLRLLREGGQAFPNDFRRNALAAQVVAAYEAHDTETLEREDVSVSVAGRIMAKRVMGRNSFVKLQDRSGQIQLFVRREVVSEPLYAEFKKWDIGDIVGARGKVFKTKTGEVSVEVSELRLLVKSLQPLPEKWHGISDPEIKLRQRYVDLIVDERSREVFRVRSQALTFIRSYLDALDFVEVETPLMHPIPGGAAAKPFETHHRALNRTLYLRIAPELYLKRLLVGGFERVYELGRVFRNEGLSTRHNPEFTLLELYQAYADYHDLMNLTENLVRETARAVLGRTEIEYQGERFDLGLPFRRMHLEDALLEAHPALERARLRDEDVLRKLCAEHKILVEPGFGAGKLQLELFEKTVEDGLRGPLFITHYPLEVSPLARRNDEDPFLTDRFELFIARRELANGFSELNDPEDQAERFRTQAEAKARGDEEAMLYDEDFIRALEYGMPPAAGLGVGIDRLIMLVTDSASIRDVLLFPQLKPEA
ncbi:MAG TPA: lysine--tRNA ligase [Gammaproteobacteria bacterium]|nr:lysine--tRNA ligase [Gammaproteobacteria bacterium]